MADLFKYYGVNPPSYTGDPNDILGSALYNSGLLRNYGPVQRGGATPGMGAMPTKNPNYPWPTFPPGQTPPPQAGPPTAQPYPPIGAGNDPNSPWRFAPGVMGSMPTWGFLPGMGIVPTPGVGQMPGLQMPTILSPQEEFMIGLISQLVGPLQGGTPPGMATDMVYGDFGEKAARIAPSPISSVSAGAGEKKMGM